MPIRVLYDAWPLAHAPLSPAANHLRQLLAAAPASVEPILALPAALHEPAPARAVVHMAVPRDRSEWEQKRLQNLAAEHGAAYIHTTARAASLLGKTPTLVSPAEVDAAGRSRLAAAQAQGGLARAHWLWPADLPHAPQAALTLLPPIAATLSAGLPLAGQLPAGTPDEFLLYHGSGEPEALQYLLQSWTWAAGSIGQIYPLLIAGLSAPQAAWLQVQVAHYELQDFVLTVSPTPAELDALLRGCTAFIHPEPAPAWGSSLRQALAYGKAIVALQEPLTEAMAGSAAYLAAAGDARSFGAAIITVVVEEGLRATLEQQAAQKSASWSAGAFEQALENVYRH